jgi:mannose-6-phosphate isomerase-like protein (cupin superfamily)
MQTTIAPPSKLLQSAEPPQELVQQIAYNNRVLAIVISSNFNQPGIHFFTPDTFSQQIAYMKHPTGKVIQPHVHNPVPREVYYTQEVLLLKKGKLRVDFYSEQQQYLESRILVAGDVILLISGGHGFEVIEEVEMIEVKQGPYVGEQDKTRFSGILARGSSLESGEKA